MPQTPGRWFVRQNRAQALLFAKTTGEVLKDQEAEVRESEAGHSAEKSQAAHRARLAWLRAGGRAEAGEQETAWKATGGRSVSKGGL